MPSLLERLNADLKDAMRAGETTRRDEIRGLISMLKAERQTKLARTLETQHLLPKGDTELTPEQQAAADRLRETTELSNDEQEAVLLLRVKQHRQSIEGFLKGHRQDLVDVEEAQLAVDQAYLPEQLDEAAIEQIVQAAVEESGAQGPRDQGKVMGLLTGRLRGRADMRAVAARVQSILNQKQAGVH
jgi:uncharacterized protein YqeY